MIQLDASRSRVFSSPLEPFALDSPMPAFSFKPPSKPADMNRATMAIKFAVLGMLFTPLVMPFGAMGIDRLQLFLMRVVADHNRSH